MDREERAIEDLEAQNEAGEDTAAAHLPEELADKEVLREKVKQAMDDLASQERHKRINLTDRDARLMKGRQGIVAGYNAQAMVSPTETVGGGTGMLVTAVDVVDEANDNAMLAPMMERAEETTGTKSQTTLADAGYFAGSHLAECSRRGQQVVVSESRQRFLKDPYHKDQFIYDEQSDSFTCPQGQTLKFIRIQHTNGVPLRLCRASGAVCQACPAFRVCTRAVIYLSRLIFQNGKLDRTGHNFLHAHPVADLALPRLHPATPRAESPSRFLIPTAPAVTLHQSIATFDSPGKSRSVNPTGLRAERRLSQEEPAGA